MPLTHHTSQQARNEKENAIHDSKRKARFQHRARLVNFDTHTVDIRVSKCSEVDVVAGSSGQVRAIWVGDEAEFVNAGDECPHETEIDEGDEERVGAGAVIGEEGCDGPGTGEHRDDEQH